jgi:hypothetical protein
MTDQPVTLTEAEQEVATTIEEVPVDQYDWTKDGDDSTPPEERPE